MPILEMRTQGDHGLGIRTVYLHRAALARLVLLTFAAGSDVSVVIKHEIQFVLCIFNRNSWSHETIICSFILYIYFELYRSTALNL